MPSKRARRTVVRRRRTVSNRSSRGYESRAVAHVSGRSADTTIGSNASTGSALSFTGTPTTTFTGLFLTPANIDARIAAIANNFGEWRLNSITFEFIQRSSTSNTFALGWSEDPVPNISMSYTRIASFDGSRVFNLGSGLKQSFTVRPRNGWLFTSMNGQSTGASYRQVAAGQLSGMWDATPGPSSGWYGTLLIHYDVSFRAPLESNSLALADEKVTYGERDAMEKTMASPVACIPDNDQTEKSVGHCRGLVQDLSGNVQQLSGLRLARQTAVLCPPPAPSVQAAVAPLTVQVPGRRP